MSKMIAIIDQPDDCLDCPLLNRTVGLGHKCILSKKLMSSIDLTKRPDWCPLQEVPEKELLWYDDERDDYYKGWNDCIDSIVGEENEKNIL